MRKRTIYINIIISKVKRKVKDTVQMFDRLHRTCGSYSGINYTAQIFQVESHILDSFTFSEKRIAFRVTVISFNLKNYYSVLRNALGLVQLIRFVL